MAVTPSFNGNDVIAKAKLRHAMFPTLGLVDADYVTDLNDIIGDVVAAIFALDNGDHVLRRRMATLPLTGADGATFDLNPTEGELLRLIDLDADLPDGTTRRCVIPDIRRKDTVAAEYADDDRPVGFVVWNGVNNRYDLIQAVHFTGVTGLRVYGVVRPALITAGTLGSQILLPYACLDPIAERLALTPLGQRANLNEEWRVAQDKIAGEALAGCLKALKGQIAAAVAATEHP